MFEGLANFFQGKGWVSNAQLDEDKRRQSQAAQNAALNQARASVPAAQYDPNTNKFTNTLQIAQANQDLPLILQRPQAQTPQVVEQPKQRTFWDNVNDFTAQANDALYGGLTRGAANIVNSFATGFNGDETQKRTEDFLRSIGQSDDNGQSRLAQGTDKNSLGGRIGQAVGGTGKLVAETVPTILLPGGAALKATQGLSTGARIAAVGGIDAGVGGLFGAGTSMAQGNSGEDILRDAAIGAALGGGIGAGTAIAEPYLQKFAAKFARSSSPAETAVSTKATLLRNADEIERTVQEAPTSQLGKLDDGISSETTANAKRAVAQENATQLRQQAEQIVTETTQPPVRQVETPSVTTKELPLTLKKATPEELLVRADTGDAQAIDEINRRFDEVQTNLNAETTAPTPEAIVAQVAEPTPPIDNPIESPITQQSREIAQSTPPVRPIDVDGTPVVDTPVSQPATPEQAFIPKNDGTQDPRISQLYQEAEQHLYRADEILKDSGSSVEELGTKLYVADTTNKPLQLTPAEREAFDYLNSNINDAERVLMSKGIIDKDLGVRREYLPTGDKSSIEQVFTPEDINSSSFNYAKGRSGGFIKSDGTISDKLPEGIRDAYTDYYVRGKGSQYLTDTQVDSIKSTRIAQTDMNDVMFGPSKEPLAGLDGKPVKIDDTQITKNADELVKLQRDYSDAAKVGDETITRNAQKAVNQKLIDNSVAKLTQMKNQIDDLVKETKASTLPREQKVARIVELENRLEYARKQASYQQSYVKTNMLFQLPGRVADQVGKITQSIGDALTSPLTRGATKDFRPTTQAGKKAAKTVARDPILNQRNNNYILNKAIGDATSSNVIEKVAGRYSAAGTKLTEYGSRQSAPTLDTARYFAAQAEAQGVDDVAGYIRNAIGTKEWDRVFNQFSTNRNRFSGIGDITGSTTRRGIGVDKSFVNTQLDSLKAGLNNSIDKAFATTLPRSVRRNMADAISIPLVGFPRVVWNVGAKGMDYATFGMTNLYKASKVNVVDSATALQKALNIRDAIEGSAAGTGLAGLGVLLGQSDMITGSEPEKQANGEWVPPYSLKLGNDYVELGRFIGPYAVPVMLSAAISRGDSAANIASIPALVTSQVLNNFGADSLGDTMSQIGDALNGDMSGLANRLPNMLSAFAPFSGEINSIANATDPYQRNTKDDDAFVQFMKQLTAKVPILREQLDAKEDQFGNKIPSSPFKAVVPLNTVGSGWDKTELGTEANRLGLKPSGSSNTQENAEDWGNRLLSTNWYKGLDDEAKKDALQSALYSGKLKDINNDLSDGQKTALGVGTLMSPDTRERWLEDSKNAVDYNVGRYENAIANGTLSAKDDNLENSSSLHYKAIASQVNATLPYWTATLEEQYKNTSKKELLAMAPDNPIRQALLALDEARAGAGVSLKDGDHSSSKYGDGSSSGSGSGSKNFSFASGSIVTPEKSEFKDPTIKSNWSTPLVKPLGIGEASAKVKRKISVKKGVAL